MRKVYNRKIVVIKKQGIARYVLIIEAPTNLVPAVAVKREEQVLFVLIGRKGYVGC